MHRLPDSVDRTVRDLIEHLSSDAGLLPTDLNDVRTRLDEMQRVTADFYAAPAQMVQSDVTDDLLFGENRDRVIEALRQFPREYGRALRRVEAALTDLESAGHRPLVGPIVAATVLTAWSHPGRCRNDAAFAMLAGTAPIPASSGKTVRYRLNRSGDRQLNRALHTVALSRLRYDERTRTYADRRRAQGKTDREIKRCLKRYIARDLYRRLENPPHPLDTP